MSIFSFLIQDWGCYQNMTDLMQSLPISLIIYSHIPAAVITLLLGIFLLMQSTHQKIRIFFILAVSLFFFITSDLIRQLTFLGKGPVYFAQSFIEILQPVIVLLALYFLYYLIKRKDAPFFSKVFILMPLIPILVVVGLQKNMIGYDATNCLYIENPYLVLYGFFVSFFYLAVSFFFSFNHVMKDRGVRKEKLVTAVGCCLFISIFFVTQNVFISQDFLVYCFFLLPFLVGLLAYLAVRFKVFKVRVATSQIFILSVFLLIFSQFFFITNTVAVILNTFLIFFMALLSHIILSGVSEEIKNREQVEELAQNLVASNQNMKKTNIKLEELNLQKLEFVSIATHQLRGPLSLMKGYALMILDGDFGKLDDKMREAINTMLKSSLSLSVIVEDYLDVSKIEQGKMNYFFSNCDLVPIIKDVITEFTPLIKSTALDISFEYDQREKYEVLADEGKIRQVISNLLDNSIKYTPTGSTQLTLSKKAGKILFSLQDTGIGISETVLPQLFARFSRAPDASKNNILGTGLGLFVAKKIVEAHNGKIWAESKGEGRGSQFYMELDEVVNHD